MTSHLTHASNTSSSGVPTCTSGVHIPNDENRTCPCITGSWMGTAARRHICQDWKSAMEYYPNHPTVIAFKKAQDAVCSYQDGKRTLKRKSYLDLKEEIDGRRDDQGHCDPNGLAVCEAYDEAYSDMTTFLDEQVVQIQNEDENGGWLKYSDPVLTTEGVTAASQSSVRAAIPPTPSFTVTEPDHTRLLRPVETLTAASDEE